MSIELRYVTQALRFLLGRALEIGSVTLKTEGLRVEHSSVDQYSDGYPVIASVPTLTVNVEIKLFGEEAETMQRHIIHEVKKDPFG